MKAESTVRREMNKLFSLSKWKAECGQHKEAEEAYAMASALQWVLQKTDWTPRDLVKATVREVGK